MAFLFFYVKRRNIAFFFEILIIVIYIFVGNFSVDCKTNKQTKNILYAVSSECDEERFVAARRLFCVFFNVLYRETD